MRAIFLASCRVLIAGSFGAVLYLAFGLPASLAVVSSIAALTLLVLFPITAAARREEASLLRQLAALSRDVLSISYRVSDLRPRIAAMEETI